MLAFPSLSRRYMFAKVWYIASRNECEHKTFRAAFREEVEAALRDPPRTSLPSQCDPTRILTPPVATTRPKDPYKLA